MSNLSHFLRDNSMIFVIGRRLGIVVAMCGVVVLATPAWSQDSQSPDVSPQLSELFSAAQVASEKGDSKRAIELLNKAIAIDDSRPDLYRWRGREQFRLGNIAESLSDFDRVALLAPNLEKTLWERGISQYYAGHFEAGAKQFELYQSYHDADVENATWRYLCVARADGVEQARESLLPIKNDPRVPMMEIYKLYQGKATPDDVLAAANAGEPAEAEQNTRLFYAHLYIGLYHEAAGDTAEAKKHIELAAHKHRIGHYMGDVARIHARRFAKNP
jgi:lipoprotein NlpI